ncbi:MAG: four-carbon acid sugar kinase family protein [SAR324 cluster bacterium]|nr:four-carbon acid sugar kinase family protein [SAR324 cluster bacterium]
MNCFGILADDFTGACDTGVQFAAMGAQVLASVSMNRLTARRIEGWDVLVINTESRNCSPKQTGVRLRKAREFLSRAGWPLRYIKVDSTLRGNLPSQLDVVLEKDASTVYLAPAFPLTGRTVEGGVLKVRGVPVHESEWAQDIWSPDLTSNVADLVGDRLKGSCGHVTLAQIEQGARAIQYRLDELRTQGIRVVICDAISQMHLSILAEAFVPRLSGSMVMGSAGIARELALRVFDGKKQDLPRQLRTRGPVVVLAGSRSEVTRRQVEALEGMPGIIRATIDPRWFDKANWEIRLGELQDSLANRSPAKGFLITISTSVAAVSTQTFRKRSAGINRLLGKFAAHLAKRERLSGIVLTGGDIAAAALQALGAYGIRLRHEVAPGIPQGTVVGGRHDGLPVITKAGGFGDRDALCRAVLSLSA